MKEFYTGAIVTESKPHEDYQLGMSSIPFDWTKGYDINYTFSKVKNQYQSYSCGGQALAYYKEVLYRSEEQSAKFIYAPIHAENGGSSSEALGQRVKKVGSTKESLCLSYTNDGTTNESFMTRASDITDEAMTYASSNKSLKYAYVRHDIESVAQAIRDNNGCIIGITGQNNNSWTSANPQPPVGNDDTWNHWVYATWAGMYKGKRAIKFINSWGKYIGDLGYQYITEDYFKSNNIFSVWVLTENAIIPRYIFTKPIAFGETSKDITYLQKRLVEEGYNQPITGYYHKITAQNVLAYQRKHNVASEGELTYLAGRRVGKKTLAMLNL